MASMADSLLTFGTSKGWTFETVGGSIGVAQQDSFEPVVHHALGIAHYYHAESHKTLNRTYGDMLDNHNATVVAATWIEKLATFNHTESPFEHLNMTHGPIVSLNDNEPQVRSNMDRNN
jgi:hypothetical protein